VTAIFAVPVGLLGGRFGTYPAVFVLTGVCMLAALVILQFIHPERARQSMDPA
jgi:hypothetical protein